MINKKVDFLSLSTFLKKITRPIKERFQHVTNINITCLTGSPYEQIINNFIFGIKKLVTLSLSHYFANQGGTNIRCQLVEII